MHDERETLRQWWVGTGHRRRLTHVLVPLLASLNGTVLDVGGGRNAPHDVGWTSGARRIRIDLSVAHDPDIQANAGNLPARNDAADGIVMIEVLEHVPDPRRLIAEAARVLHPGGTFIGSVPFVAPIHGDPHDYFRYSEEALRALLGEFDDVRVLPMGNHWGAAWTLVAARSRILRLLNPVLRNLGTHPDPRCPQGYVFQARAAAP